jgi:putative oxidoreductase
MRLVLRGTIGALFVAHGSQKLFGWFGGPGLDGVTGMMDNLGLRPPRRHAWLVGLSETVGGALLTVGTLTPLASAMLTGTMTTAIRKVHASKGPWVTEGGFEYNAVLIAAMVALAESGPGTPSVDSAMAPRMKGTGWALLALAAGVGGSYLATERFTEPAPEETAAAPGTAGEEPRFQREQVGTAAPAPA